MGCHGLLILLLLPFCFCLQLLCPKMGCYLLIFWLLSLWMLKGSNKNNTRTVVIVSVSVVSVVVMLVAASWVFLWKRNFRRSKGNYVKKFFEYQCTPFSMKKTLIELARLEWDSLQSRGPGFKTCWLHS